MRNSIAAKVALGGMFAALAAVIMILGGVIPVATYVCPVLCVVICYLVQKFCGSRMAWAWYGTTVLLVLLLAPDKEAVGVLIFFGYYPILKDHMDKLPLLIAWILKLVYFNLSTVTLYFLLIYLFGFQGHLHEFREMGTGLLVLTVFLGNIVFLMTDHLLRILKIRFK